MKIRFGYVSIALNLKKTTASSTITYARYQKLKDDEKMEKLKSVTYSNLQAFEDILNYNIQNEIHFYRITSKLIPLATHPEVLWDYKKYFRKDFEYIGNIIKKSNMRIDSHPDHFNVLNSLREDVVKNTILNLGMECDVLELMNYDIGKLIMHVGSSQNGKEDSIKRFIKNFHRLEHRIQKRLILENDDKIFDAKDVLGICKEIKIPMVLDVHHHNCNNREDNIYDYIDEIFATWNEDVLIPKIHFSSPREFVNDKKHSDNINVDEMLEFLNRVKESTNSDFDIMIEAKKKDQALFKLMDDLRESDSNIKFIDKTTIEI